MLSSLVTGCRDKISGEIKIRGANELRFIDEEGKDVWLTNGKAVVEAETKNFLFPQSITIRSERGNATFKIPHDIDFKGTLFFVSAQNSGQPYNLRGRKVTEIVKSEEIEGHAECILKPATKTQPPLYGLKSAVFLDRIYQDFYRIEFLDPKTNNLVLGYFRTTPLLRSELRTIKEGPQCLFDPAYPNSRTE